MSTVYLTKNYELVILTTSVVESVGKFGVEKLDRWHLGKLHFTREWDEEFSLFSIHPEFRNVDQFCSSLEYIFLQRRETTEKALSPGNATDRVAREFHRHADLCSTDRPNYLLSEWQPNAGINDRQSRNDTSANLETIAARPILHAGETTASVHSHGYLKVRNNATDIFPFLRWLCAVSSPRIGSYIFPFRSHVRTRNTGNRGRRMSRQASSLSRSLVLFKQ